MLFPWKQTGTPVCVLPVLFCLTWWVCLFVETYKEGVRWYAPLCDFFAVVVPINLERFRVCVRCVGTLALLYGPFKGPCRGETHEERDGREKTKGDKVTFCFNCTSLLLIRLSHCYRKLREISESVGWIICTADGHRDYPPHCLPPKRQNQPDSHWQHQE